jgi:flagellin
VVQTALSQEDLATSDDAAPALWRWRAAEAVPEPPREDAVSLRINTNIEAFNAHRQLERTQLDLGKSIEKLSSGLRINRAADDAAGLAISEKLRAQIRGIAQASRNAEDGISLVQTAEGALNEVHAILQRVRELAVQYNNGTLSTADKSAITAEIVQLSSECSRIVSQMTFNGINVLGSTSPITFQVGANTGETIILNGMNLGGTYFDSVFVGTFTTGADIDAIDMSLSSIADARAGLGAIQNRLEHTIANLATYHENLSAAESRIRDTDMALEMTTFTKLQVLQQSGVAMLGQANQAPNAVLSLIRG